VGDLREEHHLENLGDDGSIKMGVSKVGYIVCTGLFWLKRGANDRCLCI
jgi:hypothetical protein